MYVIIKRNNANSVKVGDEGLWLERRLFLKTHNEVYLLDINSCAHVNRKLSMSLSRYVWHIVRKSIIRLHVSALSAGREYTKLKNSDYQAETLLLVFMN